MDPDNIAIELIEDGEPYCLITVNPNRKLKENQFVFDINNGRTLFESFIEQGYAKIVGSWQSGYVIYPVCEMTEKFKRLLETPGSTIALEEQMPQF